MDTSPSQNSWSKAAPVPVAPQPAPTPPNRSGTSTGLKIVYGILATCAIVFVTLVVVYMGAKATPPRVTAPNRPPAPKQNGFPLLKAATEKPIALEDVGDAIARSPKKKWTIEAKRKLITRNSAAITATRNALTLPYREENNPVSVGDEFPHYKKFRHMVRVLVLAGNIAWDEGKQREAADYYLDAITIGRRLPNRTALIGRLVGIACETIGRRAIWDRLDKMDIDTASHCLARLQALQTERLPFSVTMEEEKYTDLRMAVYGMDHPDAFLNESGMFDTDSEEDKKGRRTFRTYRNVVPRKLVTDTIGTYMDKAIAQSKEPYIQGNEEIPVPRELYSSIILPSTPKARLRYVANEAGDALLRTALALRIYKKRNGKHPADLTELVAAKLLPAVPEDPFDMTGAPLHYLPSPDGTHRLYSIGPDDTDDGGKSIEVKNAKGKMDRTVAVDSKGDIVAGWYTY